MIIIVRQIQEREAHVWDRYVSSHPRGTLYHQFKWKTVIEKTYGHGTFYLAAYHENSQNNLKGVLPLVHLNHFVFGNALISIPFFDMAGLLADDEHTSSKLIKKALGLAYTLKVDHIELRHNCPSAFLEKVSTLYAIDCVVKTHKARMVLKLPPSSEELMVSFKSKLRNQIKRPLKSGFKAVIGGRELLDAFYEIFLINMRDLGSPVHSKHLFTNVMEQLAEKTRVVMVHRDNTPCAAAIVSGFKGTLGNPWASSLREYSRFSPNMLLYWTMLEYACDRGYEFFDFGRSTPGEGTYRFKRQWTSQPETLHWHYLYLNGRPLDKEVPEKSKFDKAVQLWQRLPVPVTKIIGPMIRKHIGL